MCLLCVCVCVYVSVCLCVIYILLYGICTLIKIYDKNTILFLNVKIFYYQGRSFCFKINLGMLKLSYRFQTSQDHYHILYYFMCSHSNFVNFRLSVYILDLRFLNVMIVIIKILDILLILNNF